MTTPLGRRSMTLAMLAGQFIPATSSLGSRSTTLGQENAGTVVACILERHGHITAAGGDLRDLTGRARRGEFSLLMALLRANGAPGRKAS